MTIIKVGSLSVEITYKRIKNIYLRVSPPHGQIRVSAPPSMTMADIKNFLLSRTSWIIRKQAECQSCSREKVLDYISGERIPFMGKSYPLKVVENRGKSRVELINNQLFLYIRPDMDREKRENIMNEWYRTQLKEKIPPIISQYESFMGVRIKEFRIRQMKTRWGTCHTGDQRIWINLALAKRSCDCLEYIVVHEMCHLLEKGHNKRFYRFMDQFLPDWKEQHKILSDS